MLQALSFGLKGVVKGLGFAVQCLFSRLSGRNL